MRYGRYWPFIAMRGSCVTRIGASWQSSIGESFANATSFLRFSTASCSSASVLSRRSLLSSLRNSRMLSLRAAFLATPDGTLDIPSAAASGDGSWGVVVVVVAVVVVFFLLCSGRANSVGSVFVRATISTEGSHRGATLVGRICTIFTLYGIGAMLSDWFFFGNGGKREGALEFKLWRMCPKMLVL